MLHTIRTGPNGGHHERSRWNLPQDPNCDRNFNYLRTIELPDYFICYATICKFLKGKVYIILLLKLSIPCQEMVQFHELIITF